MGGTPTAQAIVLEIVRRRTRWRCNSIVFALTSTLRSASRWYAKWHAVFGTKIPRAWREAGGPQARIRTRVLSENVPATSCIRSTTRTAPFVPEKMKTLGHHRAVTFLMDVPRVADCGTQVRWHGEHGAAVLRRRWRHAGRR